MAGKTKSIFVCSQCGYQSAKWLGKCPECESWNCFDEEIQASAPSSASKNNLFNGNKVKEPIHIDNISITDEIRYKTGISEFDRILGGGIVKGSIVLLGGEPGIGKSTLMLQICEKLSQNKSVLYISGEESQRQLKLRFLRLNIKTDNLFILTETDIEAVVDTINVKKPDIVIVDSIQTMSLSAINSSPGSVSQVRECTNLLMRTAKNEDVSIIVIGHVNKDGMIAGPKVLEHIVDAVIYFEGEKNFSYKILRAAKNRYGSTNEIGMFEMTDKGLVEITNPSKSLLEGRITDVSGSCIACIMEGTRPILAEIQVLVSKTGFGTPRRMSVGFDYNRMNLLIAVLEKRTGLFFGNLDVYINVVGGLRIDDPSADLPVAMALVSAVTDKPISSTVVAFGEIGLSGELRSVSGISKRVGEAQRMGFTTCYMPAYSFGEVPEKIKNSIDIKALKHIKTIF